MYYLDCKIPVVIVWRHSHGFDVRFDNGIVQYYPKHRITYMV